MTDADTFTVLIDFENQNVGCAILQALAGATVSNYEIAGMRWGLHPTPTQAIYTVTPENRSMWEQLKRMWSE